MELHKAIQSQQSNTTLTTTRTLRTRNNKPNYSEQLDSQDVDVDMHSDFSDSDSDSSFGSRLGPGSKKRKRTITDSIPTSKRLQHTSTTSGSLASSVPSNRPPILRLPAELLQKIAHSLPFTSDAISFSLTCRSAFNALDDNYFWYLRRRQYREYFEEGRWANLPATGQVKKDLEAKYNPRKQYRAFCFDAFFGRTEVGGAGKEVVKQFAWGWYSGKWEAKERKKGEKREVARCQICCIQRAFKYWSEFEKLLCPSCLEMHIIDHMTIHSYLTSIKGINLDSIREIVRYRKRRPRKAYWRPDIEREVIRCLSEEEIQEFFRQNPPSSIEGGRFKDKKMLKEVCPWNKRFGF